MDESSLIETPIGQIIYYLSRGRLLNYPEERPGFQIPPQLISDKKRTRSEDEETVVNDENRSSEGERKKVEEGEKGEKGEQGEKAPIPNASEGREPNGQGEQGTDPNLVDW